MKKSLTGCGVLLAACCISYAGELRAQAFAKDGQVVIGAERLTGVFIEKFDIVSTTTETAGGMTETRITENDFDSTSFALLGVSPGLSLDGGATAAGGPSMTPRLGIDVFVASGFSLGGSILFTTAAGTTESITEVNGAPDPDPEGEQDQPTSSLFMIQPRVGYGYAVSPSFAIWPRAGLSYARYSIHEEDEDTDGMGNPITVEREVTMSLTDITLEFMMAVTPFPNVAILFGPFADIGVGGSVETETTPDEPDDSPTEIDAKYTSFGLTAGLGTVF